MEPSDTDSATSAADLSIRRDRFLTFAVLFEGALSIGAMALGSWVGIHPLERLSFRPLPVLLGVFGALPPFALFFVLFHLPFGPLRQIRTAVLDALGFELSLCRWWELLALAFVTGFSEELLFRGVFQQWIGFWWSNLLFGAVHWVTPLYALWAGLMGLLMGGLMTFTGNLLTPILAHTLYDFMAFLVIAHTVRRQARESSSTLP
jgi:hypothetical protein